MDDDDDSLMTDNVKMMAFVIGSTVFVGAVALFGLFLCIVSAL